MGYKEQCIISDAPEAYEEGKAAGAESFRRDHMADPDIIELCPYKAGASYAAWIIGFQDGDCEARAHAVGCA